MQQVVFEDLGLIGYQEAWDYQEQFMQQNLAVKAARFAGSGPQDAVGTTKHHLLFCAHPHVYTLGKSGKPEHLLANEERLAAMGATFCKTNRGGDITYHGPGQIVGYPVLDLECFFTDLGRYMRSLEEVIIQMLAHWGIQGHRLSGSTGVWLDPDNPARARKICAMGVRCSRWVTMHGWALNVNTDLSYFDAIVPCGIKDKGVTSMQQELGGVVDEELVKQQLKAAFEQEFGAVLEMGTHVAAPAAITA
jgi:lipoyl(octanoyl) transferase